MDISSINWWAVIVAALSNFLIGGLWYSPILFGKAWMKENNFSDEDFKGGVTKIFVLTFLFSFIMSFNLAMFLNDSKTTTGWGAMAGFLAGFGWVAMTLSIIALFERKSAKYILIHAGYATISFIVMGLILGAWR